MTLKSITPNRSGTLSSGANILIGIILILAILLVYMTFFKTVGEGGKSLTGGITSNLTDLLKSPANY